MISVLLGVETIPTVFCVGTTQSGVMVVGLAGDYGILSFEDIFCFFL